MNRNKQIKEKICQTCLGSGEVSYDEVDRDGNLEHGVGRMRCPDCNSNEPDEDFDEEEIASVAEELGLTLDEAERAVEDYRDL